MKSARVLSRCCCVGVWLLIMTSGIDKLSAQTLDKLRLGYSGTGLNNYTLEMAKLRGADMRIIAVTANRFNHVYLAAPSITSFKQLKGKKVAVSRFGSGSHFQSNLALKEGGLDPEKDVTTLQIGNSGARLAAILSGVVDGTIMAADFVPKAKREGFNVLADLADTKIEYPFLALHMMGSYIDRNLRLAKALIK